MMIFRAHKAIAVAAVVFLASLCGAAGARGSADVVAEYPMTRLLPTKSFATLADRTIGNSRAAVYVYGKGDRGICVQQIVVHAREGVLTATAGSPECARRGPGWKFSVSLGSYRQSGMTVVGVITSQQATAKIDVELTPGGSFSQKSKALNSRQTAKAKVGPLRYAAFIIPRTGCLERVDGFSKGGETLFDTGSRECAAEE